MELICLVEMVQRQLRIRPPSKALDQEEAGGLAEEPLALTVRTQEVGVEVDILLAYSNQFKQTLDLTPLEKLELPAQVENPVRIGRLPMVNQLKMDTL